MSSNTIRTIVIAVGIFAFDDVLARADDGGGAVRSLFISNYMLRCAAAFDPNDAKRVAATSFLSPQFVSIGPNGRRADRVDLLDLSQDQVKKLHTTGCYYKIDSFTQSDADTIVVTRTLHIEGKLQEPGLGHSLTAIERSQDSWIRTDGTWLLRLSVTSKILVKVDGSVVEDLGT